MKIIARNVLIETQEFILIQSSHEGRAYFGTVPYSELNADGGLKRSLTGEEMQISWKSPHDAIENRRHEIARSRLMDSIKKHGPIDREQLMVFLQREAWQRNTGVGGMFGKKNMIGTTI